MEDQNRSKCLNKPPQYETLFLMVSFLTDVLDELTFCQKCHYHLLHYPANSRQLLSISFAYLLNYILGAAIPDFFSLFPFFHHE